MSRFNIVHAVVLTLLLHVTAVQHVDAQETTGSHLKGVTSVAVHVDTGAAPSVSMSQLETALEQRLREAGITVMPDQAPRVYGTQGRLFAKVMVLRRLGESQCTLAIQTRLYGSVVLAGSSERAEAITWENERFVIISTSEIDTQVRENLNFLIDDFARAYRAANLK